MDRVDAGDGLRVIDAIDSGGLPAADVYSIMRDFDPLYSYFILYYLREKNQIDEYQSGGGQRLLQLVGAYDDLARLLRETPKDSMVEWFHDSYNIKQFFSRPKDFVNLIVDKLEG
jgi:hypothetical protein